MITTIFWTNRITIEEAGQLRNELLAAGAEAVNLRVDLTNCTYIDASGLQLLCAAVIDARARGATFGLLLPPGSAAHVTSREAGFLRHSPCRTECGDSCVWLHPCD